MKRLLQTLCCMLLSGTALAAAAAEEGAAAPGQDKDPPGAAPEADAGVGFAPGPPVPLDIARGPMRNFLEDETATALLRAPGGELRDFADVFTVGSERARFALLWEPVTCRLVGVLDLDPPAPPAAERGEGDEAADGAGAPSPFLLKASGPAPFTATIGAFGTPRYFGFQIVEGMPQFLYTHGALVVEERLWLEEGGHVLRQLFCVREPDADLLLTLPAEWVERLEDVSAGTLRGGALSVPRAEAGRFVLTYRLAAPSPEETLEEPDEPDEPDEPEHREEP